MVLLFLLYLAIGLYVECAVFTVNPDWFIWETWRHLLLWPAYLVPALNIQIPGLPHINWLDVTLLALLLAPLPGVWFARRLRQQGMRRKKPTIIYDAQPEPEPARERMEPRLAG